MSTYYDIPLINNAQTCTVSLGGSPYELTVLWNSFSNTWVLDITDDNGNDIITGIPLVAGSDLLEQFAYLSFGGALRAMEDSNFNTPPSFNSLGDTGHLYFVTTP